MLVAVPALAIVVGATQPAALKTAKFFPENFSD